MLYSACMALKFNERKLTSLSRFNTIFLLGHSIGATTIGTRGNFPWTEKLTLYDQQRIGPQLLEPIGMQIWRAKPTFIHKYWYQQFELLISTIPITDITNYNCWYQLL